MKPVLSILMVIALATAAGNALAAGDPVKGKKNFRMCKTCHTLVKGKKRVGPSLYGLFGRKAASEEKYKYSKSLEAAGEKGLVWDEKNLFAYLADPTAFLKTYLGQDKVSNKMKNKFKKEVFRNDLIAYLKEATKKE